LMNSDQRLGRRPSLGVPQPLARSQPTVAL
jgi:hypothetical protein